ncbi:unnamed protein product [Macrosiphum euphorbiae]|uniref:DUF4817 domain-containing protein n=1 Tax=Macrosiphum euphorbiae TaxID=13131 RepID=A0AAV0XNK2_9HEMI|nr:unnamed protein product [Macrosiphum euphorbiae]
MATPQQKAFCVLRFNKCESAITVQRDFRRTYGTELLLLKAFDVGTKLSKKVVVCVHRNAQVDLVPLTKTSSEFDKVSFEVHRSLHVVQA